MAHVEDPMGERFAFSEENGDQSGDAEGPFCNGRRFVFKLENDPRED